MAFLTSRDEIRQGSPKWLQGLIGEKLLYSWSLVVDGLTEILTLAVRSRFPTAGAQNVSGALQELSRARRLPQMPDEEDSAFAERLKSWLTTHKQRGNPYGLLEQLRLRYQAAPFPIALVYLRSGKRYNLPTDGSAITTDSVTALPATAAWARWMLVFQLPGVITRDGSWDSPGVWDDGGLWDFEIDSSEVDDLLRIPADWNAAHTTGYLALLDDTTSDLYSFPGGALTDGDPPLWVGTNDEALVLRVPSPVVLL